MVARHRPVTLACRSRGAQQIEELIEGGPPIEVEQRIAATPATVFSYLTDPNKFAMWMGVAARLDPQPGGIVRIDVDGEHIATGEYREVDPPRRVVFSWGWESDPEVPPGSTTVEITLTPEGEGTLLRLRHYGLPTDQQQSSHRSGWVTYTGRLGALFVRPS